MFRLNHSELVQTFSTFLASDFKGEVFLGLGDVRVMLGLDWCLIVFDNYLTAGSPTVGIFKGSNGLA